MNDGRPIEQEPKSRAGRGTVSFSQEIVGELRWHLECFAMPGADGLVFVGPLGGRLRRSTLRRQRTAASPIFRPERASVYGSQGFGRSVMLGGRLAWWPALLLVAAGYPGVTVIARRVLWLVARASPGHDRFVGGISRSVLCPGAGQRSRPGRSSLGLVQDDAFH